MANLWGIKSQETRVKAKKERLKKLNYFVEPIRVIIFDIGSVQETQIQEPLQNKKNPSTKSRTNIREFVANL